MPRLFEGMLYPVAFESQVVICNADNTLSGRLVEVLVHGMRECATNPIEGTPRVGVCVEREVK